MVQNAGTVIVDNQRDYIRAWRAEKPGYSSALYHFHKEREKLNAPLQTNARSDA